MASPGERVYEALKTASTPTIIGSDENETVQTQMKGNDSVTEEQVKLVMVTYWDTIAPALIGNDKPIAEYRELRVYDGTPKRSDPTQIHIDHFIPETNFHGNPNPDYTEFERNKEDQTDIPEFDTGVNPSELEDTRNGFRIIINDDKVQADSIILPVINYLDSNEENDLPSNYIHVSPGSTSTILNQREGEFQIFFEQKGAYMIKYSVWNFERNVDSEPTAVAFADTP